MNIELPTKPFLESLQSAAAICPARTPKDILKAVRLTASDRVVLTASDSEVSLRCAVPEANVKESGETLLAPRRMLSILRETDVDCVVLTLSDGKLQCKAGRNKFTLQSGDPSEFPTFSEIDGDAVSCDAEKLSKAIGQVFFAADEQSQRYALGGICFEPGYLAATDSRRLSTAEVNTVDEGRRVIPLKAAKILAQAMSGSVDLQFSPNSMYASDGVTEMQARLVEGRFPQWQDIIPQQFERSVDLIAGPLLSTVRQAMIVMTQESRGADFEFDGGTLWIRSTGKEVGNSDVCLPVDVDWEFNITLQPQFVADWLKTLEPTDVARLHLNDPTSAAMFECGDSRYVVMPLAKDWSQ